MSDDNFWPGPDTYDIEVVGESHYQKELRRIAGPTSDDGVNVKRRAELYFEPNNPHDPNAVCVRMDGRTVGYLSREVAPAIRAALKPAGIKDGMSVEVNALILGGRTGQNYGVWLDIPTTNRKPAESKPSLLKRMFGR